MNTDLEAICDSMTGILGLFVSTPSLGKFLPSEHSATYKSLAIEAKVLLDEELGRLNDFSINLVHAINSGAGGYIDGPSYASIEEAIKIVQSGNRTISRKAAKRIQTPLQTSTKFYVDLNRISALQQLGNAKWDFSRLIELCRELNIASNSHCHMSTAMLLRSILDHIPPVFGKNTFEEVANNYGDPKSQKSFKTNMKRLQGSLRSIADLHLHSIIRTKEDVPTAVQVDFSTDLDVLLGEVIRLSKL